MSRIRFEPKSTPSKEEAPPAAKRSRPEEPSAVETPARDTAPDLVLTAPEADEAKAPKKPRRKKAD